MVSPVSFSYSCASGGIIAGGIQGLPSWLPAVGAIADVSLNTIYDVRGTSDVLKTYEAWSGNAYLPDLGLYGSILSTGGGHADGSDNSIWRYDVATRLNSKIKMGAAVFEASDTYIANGITGWMWSDTGGVNMQVGEPFTAHFYSNIIGLPASAIPGHENGLMYTAGRAIMPRGGQRGCPQAHKYDPASNLWSLSGTAFAFANSYGPAWYDSLRNRVVTMDGVSSRQQIICIDLSTDVTSTLGVNAYVKGYYATGSYNAAKDLYQSLRWDGTLGFVVIDPKTGVVTTPTVTGVAPTVSDTGGWEWVEAWQALIYYPGYGQDVWTLKAPSDPASGPWAWGKQTLTGSARSIVGNPHYNRIKYIAALDTFIWCARTDHPNQAFRISAP